MTKCVHVCLEDIECGFDQFTAESLPRLFGVDADLLEFDNSFVSKSVLHTPENVAADPLVDGGDVIDASGVGVQGRPYPQLMIPFFREAGFIDFGYAGDIRFTSLPDVHHDLYKIARQRYTNYHLSRKIDRVSFFLNVFPMTPPNEYDGNDQIGQYSRKPEMSSGCPLNSPTKKAKCRSAPKTGPVNVAVAILFAGAMIEQTMPPSIAAAPIQSKPIRAAMFDPSQKLIAHSMSKNAAQMLSMGLAMYRSNNIRR